MPRLVYTSISLRLLRVTKPQLAVERSFDPSRLPWLQGVDRNPGTPFLGDEAESRPLQNRNLVLLPGVHLHWQAPVELTRGRPDGTHPPLPDRWLVTRVVRREDGEEMKRWIVESDYLHSATAVIKRPHSFTLFPAVGDEDHGPSTPPFRRVGRTLPLEEWLAEAHHPRHHYLPNLNVLSTNHPAFTAFYPDCQGIFTFYDADSHLFDRARVGYEISGWYARAEQDQSSLFDEGASTSRPHLICYGRSVPSQPGKASGLLRAASRPRRQRHSAMLPEAERPVMAVGATATEALSAYLGRKMEGPLGLSTGVIEAQLEGILLQSQLNHCLQDHHEEFIQARHAKEFIGSQGGAHWVIRPIDESPHGRTPPEAAMPVLPPAKASKSRKKPAPASLPAPLPPEPVPPPAPPMPDVCLPLLHALNREQRKWDRLKDQRFTLAQRFSADWHKYLLCAYPEETSRDELPEADAVKFLLTSGTMVEIRRVQADLENQEEVVKDRVAQIEQELVTHHRKATLAAQRAGTPPPTMRQALQARPGPRFWAPRDPVLVCESPAEVAGYLRELRSLKNRDRSFVQILETPEDDVTRGQRLPVPLLSLVPPSLEGFEHPELTDHPAVPLFVEWAANLKPVARVSPPEIETDGDPFGIDPLEEDRAPDYPADYLSRTFAPSFNRPELTSKREIELGESAAYTGRSLVSTTASQVLREKLRDYLINLGLPSLPQPPPLPVVGEDWDVDEPTLISLIAQAPAGSLVRTALQAWQVIHGARFLCLALSGFNEALLMRRPIPQLPIADPTGFHAYKLFAAAVKRSVGGLSHMAPEPEWRFHPIRAGSLEMDHARLIDTFGRTYELTLPNYQLVASATLGAGELMMVNDELRAAPFFFPRFIQPLRVDFRWLAAGHGNEEAHSHPDTSPICGWLLPQLLDQSLHFYDSSGLALGSIDSAGIWRAPPGDEHPVAPPDIAEPHLRRVVVHLLDSLRKGAQLNNFLTLIVDSLEAIDPDSTADHSATALLFGRPVAIVRTKIKFELKGEPTEDHSWSTLDDRLAGKRDSRSRQHEKVQIPFRIGEHSLLNDGVVGYWVEREDGAFLDGHFHSPTQSEDAWNSPDTRTPTEEEPATGGNVDRPSLVLRAAPSDAPLFLTMLMDPRGSAHLTSGVLPVKEIRLDEHHYVQQLKRLAVTFLAAPLLMSKDHTEIALPGEPGFAWSFLERKSTGWVETPADKITRPEEKAAFRGRLTLREGWLRLEPKSDEPGAPDASAPASGLSSPASAPAPAPAPSPTPATP